MEEEPEPAKEDPLLAGHEDIGVENFKEEPDDDDGVGLAIKEEPDDGGIFQLIEQLEDVAENLLTRFV